MTGIITKNIKAASGICSLAMFLILGGCALFKPLPQPPIILRTVNISLDSDANNNSATSIDLLIVYNQDLLKVLLSMESKDYFRAVNQLRRDYPDLVDIWHWELTPGQNLKDHPVDLRIDTPQGAVIFADYYSPGAHRVRLGSFKEINVHLRKVDFCLIEQGCFSVPLAGESYTDIASAMEQNLKRSRFEKSDAKGAITEVSAIKDIKEKNSIRKEVEKQAKNFYTVKKKIGS